MTAYYTLLILTFMTSIFLMTPNASRNVKHNINVFKVKIAMLRFIISLYALEVRLTFTLLKIKQFESRRIVKAMVRELAIESIDRTCNRHWNVVFKYALSKY